MNTSIKRLKLIVTTFILIFLFITITGCSNKQQAQLMPKDDNQLKQNMSTKQENDNDSLQQSYDLQKDYIANLLEKDLITKRQADYMLERLNAAKNYYEAIGDNWLEKEYQFRKDAIQKQLERGFITKKQADYMLTRLSLMKNYYEEGNTRFRGISNMYNMHYSMMGPGMYSPMMGPQMMPNSNFGPGMMYDNSEFDPRRRGMGPNMMR